LEIPLTRVDETWAFQVKIQVAKAIAASFSAPETAVRGVVLVCVDVYTAEAADLAFSVWAVQPKSLPNIVQAAIPTLRSSIGLSK